MEIPCGEDFQGERPFHDEGSTCPPLGRDPLGKSWEDAQTYEEEYVEASVGGERPGERVHEDF